MNINITATSETETREAAALYQQVMDRGAREQLDGGATLYVYQDGELQELSCTFSEWARDRARDLVAV